VEERHLKVLQINSVYGIGSTGRITRDINGILKEKMCESYVIYGRGNAGNNDNVLKMGKETDVINHILISRLFDAHGMGSKKSTRNIIKEIDKIDPDVIHLHNIHGYYINIKLLFDYIKNTNKPVVWTFHDCWPFTGHCAYFDYANCEKWMTHCHNCPEKNSYPSSKVLDRSQINYSEKKYIFNNVENMTIVTPSEWLKSKVEKSFLKNYPVKVINNGIDLTKFKPSTDKQNKFRSKYGLEEDYIILGVASTWDRRKGLKYFIELAAQLKQDERIVLVGLTKDQVKNLPNNIIGITRTANIEELADIYSSSDVFVNPTLEDNFPTTNIEALACGTPVVTFDTGGSPEIIKTGCGYVVGKGDLLSLRDKIQLIKKNGKSLYIEAAVSAAKNHYEKNDCFNKYISLYERVTSK